MNCLCCGKKLAANEEKNGWHTKCIKKFFGTDRLPDIEIDSSTIKRIALESTNKGYTVPGVQRKLSLHLHSDPEQPRMTLVNYPTGYILKPQVPEFCTMPESEQLVMSMADISGIYTVPHALIKTNDGVAYITKRVDRTIKKDSIKMLAMEDFCQLDNRLTQDKYKGSYERCSKIIEKYSSRKGLDMSELFMRIVFCFITGNSDMHLKNFSLKETKPGNRNFQLSKAYDLLPVNVIMPEDKEQLALTINGKKRNIHKKEFRLFAESCEIPANAAKRMTEKICSMEGKFLNQVEEAYLSGEQKERVKELISERIEILT